MSAQNASSISVGARAMIKSIVVDANARFGHKTLKKIDTASMNHPAGEGFAASSQRLSLINFTAPSPRHVLHSVVHLECPECPVTTSFSFHIPRTITTDWVNCHLCDHWLTCVITDSLVRLLSHLCNHWLTFVIAVTLVDHCTESLGPFLRWRCLSHQGAALGTAVRERLLLPSFSDSLVFPF